MNNREKFTVTFEIVGYYTVEVEADNSREAELLAENEVSEVVKSLDNCEYNVWETNIDR